MKLIQYFSTGSLNSETVQVASTPSESLETPSYPRLKPFQLPDDFDRSEVIRREITPKFARTAMCILGAVKCITDHKNRCDHRYNGDAYANLSNSSIQKYFSNVSSESPKLLRAMQEAGWIEINHDYEPTVSSKGYRIGPRFSHSTWSTLEWGEALKQHVPELYSKAHLGRHLRRAAKMWERACKHFTNWEDHLEPDLKAVCSETKRILEGLSINDRHALEEAILTSALEEGATAIQIKSWRDCIQAIHERDFHLRCKGRFSNRLFTNWTGLKRNFRPYFDLYGRPLTSIDIQACQLALLTKLYRDTRHDTEERERYVSFLTQGDPYTTLARDFEVWSQRSTSRSDAKIETIFLMFAQTRHQRQFYDIFKQKFPILAHRMEERKSPDHRELARTLQSLESKIMIRGVLKELLLERKLDCLSIHDSIWCFSQDVETVKESIVRHFEEEMGFLPTLKVEPSPLQKAPTWFRHDIAQHGQHIAKALGSSCHTQEQVITQAWGMPVEGDLTRYFKGMPEGLKFPCAVLSELQVHPQHRDLGFENKAMEEFEKFAKDHECAMAFLLVGENWVEDRDEIVSFHGNRGWQLYRNTSADGEYMFRFLAESPAPENSPLASAVLLASIVG